MTCAAIPVQCSTNWAKSYHHYHYYHHHYHHYHRYHYNRHYHHYRHYHYYYMGTLVYDDLEKSTTINSFLANYWAQTWSLLSREGAHTRVRIRQALPDNKLYNTQRRASGSDNITPQKKWTLLTRRSAIVLASVTNRQNEWCRWEGAYPSKWKICRFHKGGDRGKCRPLTMLSIRSFVIQLTLT